MSERVEMKKVLVTGGLGYIGSHTAVALIESGYEVIIIDDLSNASIEVLSGIERITGVVPEFHQLDLCDAHQLSLFLSDSLISLRSFTLPLQRRSEKA